MIMTAGKLRTGCESRCQNEQPVFLKEVGIHDSLAYFEMAYF